LGDFYSATTARESRDCLVYITCEDQSSQQVARLLEQSEANIRQKLSRVRKLLQEQILAKHGALIVCLPLQPLGFSSLVLGALTTSSPVAAATLASSAASGKSGLFY